jgi:hypothetical protein
VKANGIRQGDGTFAPTGRCEGAETSEKEHVMHGIIYLVGLVVVVMAILSLFGLA